MDTNLTYRFVGCSVCIAVVMLHSSVSLGDHVQETAEYAGWAEGDWNGDGIFASGDMITAFVDGGYEQGPRAGAVPEPGGWSLLLLGAGALLILRRRV
jgi:hypothetical protein